jgi:hypothetical protein
MPWGYRSRRKKEGDVNKAPKFIILKNFRRLIGTRSRGRFSLDGRQGTRKNDSVAGAG